MAGKDSQDGCATVAGGAVIGCIVLVSMIPMPVWIGFGIAEGDPFGGPADPSPPFRAVVMRVERSNRWTSRAFRTLWG